LLACRRESVRVSHVLIEGPAFDKPRRLLLACSTKLAKVGPFLVQDCAFRRWRPPRSGAWRPPIPGWRPAGVGARGTIGELVISVLSGLVKRDAARPRSQ